MILPIGEVCQYFFRARRSPARRRPRAVARQTNLKGQPSRLALRRACGGEVADAFAGDVFQSNRNIHQRL